MRTVHPFIKWLGTLCLSIAFSIAIGVTLLVIGVIVNPIIL